MRIWRPLAVRLNRASQVPWCGVPSVTMPHTRSAKAGTGSPARTQAWRQVRHQARAASPPMLWPTNKGRRPVWAVIACTARSMAGA